MFRKNALKTVFLSFISFSEIIFETYSRKRQLNLHKLKLTMVGPSCAQGTFRDSMQTTN
jgi:hypothetical protein